MTRQHRGRGEALTSPRRLQSVDRQRQALQLRAGGATYQQIADALGYRGAAGALKAVRAGLLATLQEPADELRTLELARLDALLRAVWPKAMRGELTAVDRVLKIMERRANLLGLDAPVRVNIGALVARAVAEFGLSDAERRELEESVRWYLAEQGM